MAGELAAPRPRRRRGRNDRGEAKGGGEQLLPVAYMFTLICSKGIVNLLITCIIVCLSFIVFYYYFIICLLVYLVI